MNCYSKYYLTFLLAIILSASSNAQILRVLKGFDEVEFGLGPNIFKAHQNPAPNTSMRLGFTGTLNVLYKVKPRFLISGRMFYSYWGYSSKFETLHYDPTIDSTNCKCTVSLGEVETVSNSNLIGIGILTRIKVKGSNLFFEVGPFATYFIRGTSITKSSWDNNIYKNRIQLDYRASGGISLSAGYRVPMSKSLGLNLILIENLNLIDYINSTITFQIGINFQEP